jgi:uncharacterized protein YegP (UPF0339 family)
MFVYVKTENGIEFTFISEGGSQLLEYIQVPDMDTFDEYLRCIRRCNDPESYGYCIYEYQNGDGKVKQKCQFILKNKDGVQILTSRVYESKQKCKQALDRFIKQKYGAKVYELKEKV